MEFEVLRLFFELAVLHPEDQLLTRKFKAILLRLPGLIQCFLEVTDIGRGPLKSCLMYHKIGD